MGTSKLSRKPDEMLGVTCNGLASGSGGVVTTWKQEHAEFPGHEFISSSGVRAEVLDPVVRKSVGANPGLKVKLGFDFS